MADAICQVYQDASKQADCWSVMCMRGERVCRAACIDLTGTRLCYDLGTVEVVPIKHACCSASLRHVQYRSRKSYKDPNYLGPRIADKVLISLLLMVRALWGCHAWCLPSTGVLEWLGKSL